MASTQFTLVRPDSTVPFRDAYAVCVILRTTDGQICLVSSPDGVSYDLPYFCVEGSTTYRQALEQAVQHELGYDTMVEADPFAISEQWRQDEHKVHYCYAATLVSVYPTTAGLGSRRVEWMSPEDAAQRLNQRIIGYATSERSPEHSLYFFDQLLKVREINALAPVDPNVRSASGFNPLGRSNEAEKPIPSFAQESQQHQFLHSKVLAQQLNGKQVGTYVSPSDEIMSPASAKLNAVKERRFAKSAKPRTLFTESRFSSSGKFAPSGS